LIACYFSRVGFHVEPLILALIVFILLLLLNSPFPHVRDDACHDDGNHERNCGHDHGLEGDAFLLGVTLAQHRHILVSSSPIPNSW
jgi:hypothetical protein